MRRRIVLKRFFGYLIWFFILVNSFNLQGLAAPRKIIYLDASILPEGPLKRWHNLGTIGGDFIPVFRSLPSVQPVSGQRGVNLTGRDILLRSTFTPPSSLNGQKPFTILAKVYFNELGQRQIILNWSQEVESSAIFGLGKGLDAAFYNSVKNRLGYKGGFPLQKTWHLLALVYDQQKISIYVDGWLNSQIDARLDIKSGKSIYLGGQVITGFPLPFDPLNGYLATLEVLDEALSPMTIWNLAGHREAIPVYPAEGEVLQTVSTSLKWEKGDDRAALFSVYFSSSKEEVEKGVKKAAKGNFPAESQACDLTGLRPGQVYFWRVDQLDAQGKLLQAGQLRSFAVDDGSARNPSPHHLHGSVRSDLKQLSWKPGPWATSQDIYFSSDLKKLEKSKPAARGIKPGSDFFYLPEKELDYGHSYYWKVTTKNDRLPESPGQLWSFRVQDQLEEDDLTFFVVSDLHYGGTVNFRKLNRQTVEAMNSLPGQLYPEDKGVKGKVHIPRGVVITGDIVDDGSAPDIEKTWQEYVEDYGLTGDKLLAFPVYEGFGESDGPSSGLVRVNLKSRNRLRSGLRSISADGLHYSWDWGQVHFVQLNLYPGSAGEEYLNIWRRRVSGDARYPKHSLEFLIDDLRRNVGSSGRPVVLFEHYGFDSWSEAFWTEKERSAFLQTIQPYNIIAIFWGHSEVPQGFSWNGIKTWCAGTSNHDPDPGEFLVVKITTGRKNGQLVVATREINSWGSVDKTSFPVKKAPQK
ncbi:MAG: metallophosphoesterase [Candidatus Saccharicenans sp.]|nr:metallophosphoesterase [Candidatus Saccharicenans sp.]